MSEISKLNGYDIKDKKSIRTYDTVSSMIADTDIKEGQHIKTRGYYSIDDGGSAEYIIVDDNTLVENGGNIHALDNGLYATLIDKYVIPEQFGCYGDGIHDDTTPLKKLINYLEINNLPLMGDGTYLLTEELTIVGIDIVMPNATLINPYGVIVKGSNKTLNMPRIISDQTRADATGLTLFECYSCNVTVNYIKGFETGLLLTTNNGGCAYNIITIIEIRNCINSLVLENTTGGWVNENTFIGGRLFNESQYVNQYGSEIKIISLKGNTTYSCNNNYFLKTCIEGDEGASNGIKIKLEYADYNYFDNLRYEGSNPKVDSQNSLYNVLNCGFNLQNVSYVNDTVTSNCSNIKYLTTEAGKMKGYYQDIQPMSNSYPIFNLRNTQGQLVTKIMNNGIYYLNASNGKNVYRFYTGGIAGYYDDVEFLMFRTYGKNTVIPNCDGVNHSLVISPSTTSANGCWLWVYNGHLYGKMGEPSDETDGTVIL